MTELNSPVDSVAVVDALFPRSITTERLTCPACDGVSSYEVPRLLDWRDRLGVERLRACVSALACRGCGRVLTLCRPVLVLRPGDPVRLMAGLPFATELDDDLAELKALLAHPAAVRHRGGRPVPVRMQDIGALADRYTGFALARVGDLVGWSEDERAWLDSIRTQLDVSDLGTDIRDFLQAPTGSEAETRARGTALLDPAWQPVVDEWLARTVAEQVDPAAAELVKTRATILARLRTNDTPLSTEDYLDAESAALLAAATEGDPYSGPERAATLWRFIERLRGDDRHVGLLAGALISYVAAASSGMMRTAESLEHAIDVAPEAIAAADTAFGPTHRFTLTARQNYAAALLDCQRGSPVEHEERAQAIFAEVARAVIEAEGRGLADVLQNWAAALSHHARHGRTDNQEVALRLFRDALHVQRLLEPSDRHAVAMIELNTAAALRERRAGNVRASTREAVALYAKVLDDATASGLLSSLELAQGWANRVTALFQLRRLAPAVVSAADIVATARAAARRCSAIPAGDPVRIRGLANLGSVLGDLYQHAPDDDGAEALLAEGVALTHEANEQARQTLPAGHPERVRLGHNHTVNLGRRAGHESTVERLLTELLAETGDATLLDHRYTIARNLGQQLTSRGRWSEATAAFEISLSAVQALYEDARTAVSRLAELSLAADLAGWLAVLLLVDQRADDAVAMLERSRARLLTDRALSRPPPPYERPVLYVGVGRLGSWVILDAPGWPALGARTGLTTATLQPLVATLRQARTSAELAVALDAVAGALGPAILQPVRVILQESGLDDIDVVQSGLLSGLPLHALPEDGQEGPCWLDRATVRYIPSRTVAASWPGRFPGNPAAGPSSLVLADPGGDLSCARHEPALLPASLGPVRPGPGSGDRAAWLLRGLGSATHAHLACHARFDPDEPLRSTVDVGAGHSVSLAELLEVDCSGLDLAVLSGCSTGVPQEALADELLGFATGLLLAGARSVVVSSWDLGDLPSSLVMAWFYRRLGEGAEPGQALREAQSWVAGLRVSDIEVLRRDAREPGTLLPLGLASELSTILFAAGEDPDARPLRHPGHWGGFCYYGPV